MSVNALDVLYCIAMIMMISGKRQYKVMYLF